MSEMFSFQKTPLKKKLKLVMMFTSFISTLLVCTGIFVYEFFAVRQNIIGDLVTKAEIVGANCNAALVFENPSDASQTLSALTSQPNIIAAALFTKQGTLFASYIRSGSNIAVPQETRNDGYYLEEGKINLFQTIRLNDTRNGTIFLSSDLERLYTRFSSFVEIVLLVLIGSLTVTYFSASALQNRISGPVQELVETTKRISEQQDYSLRAQKNSEDEFGTLADAYNTMLSKVQERDASLQKANKSMASEIIERKHAEEELRNAERRYRTTLDHMMEGCQIIGFDLRYLYVNDVAAEQGRRSRNELLGHTMMDTYPGIEVTPFFAQLRRCMDERIPQRMENEFTYPDGTTGWFNLSLEPVPEGTFILSEDITDKKILNKELEKHREHLEELVNERTAQLEVANKELETFSYSVSHDLRAPLRSIDGFSKILLENPRSIQTEPGQKNLQRVCNAAQRMGHLIDDMLNLSRISRTELVRQTVNLSLVAREIFDELRRQHPDRQVDFMVGEEIVAICDPRLIRIALDNLLGNAWKYTRKQSHTKIEFGTANHNGHLAYYVRDNGAGFDMTYADKLFGAFQRLHTEAEFEGTGIGLATVARIVHRHGGDVWAEGAVNEGATFYFSFSRKAIP